MKEKYEKISNIEVVEEIKYLGVIVQAKRNVFEGQKNEIMKKIKRLSVMTNSVIEKSCHRVMMGKTYWKGVVLPSALYGAEVIDMKAEEIDKLQKAENTAMRRILKAPKWTAQAAIRGEIGISNMKARIARSRLLYLRRIETGNNEVLKRILEDSKKHKKSKWWETTRKIEYILKEFFSISSLHSSSTTLAIFPLISFAVFSFISRSSICAIFGYLCPNYYSSIQ